jgi:hypothetical protein
MATAVETLDRPQTSLQELFMKAPKDHVIWSEEHKAWWRPHGSGYTDELRRAGRYTKDEAEKIVLNANMGAARFNEMAFRLPPDFDFMLRHKTER